MLRNDDWFEVVSMFLDAHTITDVLCSKWTSDRIDFRSDIALRSSFSQKKSTIVYIYRIKHKSVLLLTSCTINLISRILKFYFENKDYILIVDSELDCTICLG